MFVKCSESRAKAAHFLFDLRNFSIFWVWLYKRFLRGCLATGQEWRAGRGPRARPERSFHVVDDPCSAWAVCRSACSRSR